MTDQKKLEKLFRQHYRQMYRLATILLHDDAESKDVVHDIFRNLRERWTGYYPVTTMGKDAYVYTQSIGLSLSYDFNTTRSKYKGTGAGNAEKNRL